MMRSKLVIGSCLDDGPCSLTVNGLELRQSGASVDEIAAKLRRSSRRPCCKSIYIMIVGSAGLARDDFMIILLENCLDHTEFRILGRSSASGLDKITDSVPAVESPLERPIIYHVVGKQPHSHTSLSTELRFISDRNRMSGSQLAELN